MSTAPNSPQKPRFPRYRYFLSVWTITSRAMDSPPKAKIRYTTKTVTQTWDHFIPNQSPMADSRCGILSSSLDVQANDAPPATIEIVTVVNAVHVPTATHHTEESSSSHLFGTPSTEVRDRVMIIHSEALTQTIRDVVQFYPGYVFATAENKTSGAYTDGEIDKF